MYFRKIWYENNNEGETTPTKIYLIYINPYRNYRITGESCCILILCTSQKEEIASGYMWILYDTIIDYIKKHATVILRMA